MTSQRNDTIRMDWVRRVRDSLGTHGYYYEPEFCVDTNDAGYLVAAARLLGDLHVPSGTSINQPVIFTQPSALAPQWRPFDQHSAIGWHNDFSTRPGRPELSFSLICQEDPVRPNGGAWRVASAASIIDKLRQTREGQRLIADLSARAESFGYRDAGGWHPFRVVIKASRRLSIRGLRFYGRALEEGAWLRFGRIPDRTREIVMRMEEAADAVGEVLPASTGALLIVDNRFSLHDRTQQQVTGPENGRRQAWLCFIKKLHHPL